MTESNSKHVNWPKWGLKAAYLPSPTAKTSKHYIYMDRNGDNKIFEGEGWIHTLQIIKNDFKKIIQTTKNIL